MSKSNKFSAAVRGDFPVHDDRNKFTCVVFKLFIALFVLWSFYRFLYRYQKLIMSQSSSVFRSILSPCVNHVDGDFWETLGSSFESILHSEDVLKATSTSIR